VLLAIVWGMVPLSARHGARAGALIVIACTALAAAACGSSSPSSSSSSSSTAKAAAKSGTANVAYASSLEYLNEKVVGPAFTKAEGYQYSGRAGASGDLSSDIASGEISPNVFESVGADNITPLEPKFTKWYVQYAGTSMVVAYNPKSKYASQFKAFADGTKPLQGLFTLMQTPGFRLGRTDPNIDPQGRDFIYMLELAQSYYHLPSDTVTKILGGPPGSSTSPQIYAESSLDATLQSGQLDASSAFITQAIELHLPYIPLPPAINLGDRTLAAQYAKATITITPPGGTKTTKSGSPQVIDITIIGKPTPAGTAFVKYTLSPAGLALYKAGGFTLLTPTVTGTGVPAAISSELGS
jgi:molybdate/tungstate transport system substrate-binding protein